MTRIHDRWSRIRTDRYLIYYMSILGGCICNVHPAIKVSSLASSTIPRHVSPTMSFIPSKPQSHSHRKKLTQLVLFFFMLLAAQKTSLFLSSLTTISTKTALFQMLCLSYDAGRFHPHRHTSTIHLVKGDSSNLQYRHTLSYSVH